MKETMEEVGRQDHEPMLVEVGDIASLGFGWGTTSPVGALHPVTSFNGRRPFSMRRYSFASITDEGIHSPILRQRQRRKQR